MGVVGAENGDSQDKDTSGSSGRSKALALVPVHRGAVSVEQRQESISSIALIVSTGDRHGKFGII